MIKNVGKEQPYIRDVGPAQALIKRRCHACGKGAVVPITRSNGVAIPTCDHCGEEWIDWRTAEALDAVQAR